MDKYYELMEVHEIVLGAEAMKCVWQNTKESSRLRHCLLDGLAATISTDMLKKVSETYPRELLTDLTRRLIELRRPRPYEVENARGPSSKYYEHDWEETRRVQ